MSIEQFQVWAMPYTSHRQSCSEGCQPNRPRCFAGFRAASECVSSGPIAWLKENHDDNCFICHSGGFRCGEGEQWVGKFIAFLNGTSVAEERHFRDTTRRAFGHFQSS